MKNFSGNNIEKQIAMRNIKSEHRRNSMILLAIILASFLLSFAGLLATSVMQNQKNQVQDTYEAVYMNVSKKDIGILKSFSDFKSVGEYYLIGEKKSKQGFIGFYIYMDNPMLYMARNQVKLKEGKLPSKYNEIVVSKTWLKKYAKDKKIGNSIKIDTENFEGQYTISGILEEQETDQKIYSFIVSVERLKKYTNFNESNYLAYVHMNDNIKLDDIKGLCYSIARENNLSVGFNDKYFMYAEKTISTEQITMILFLSTIVLFGSCIVIQSMFQISIIDKIRNYGQLRTIGATKRQIKSIVKYEGKKLGIAGILIGIAISIVASFIIMPQGFNPANYVMVVIMDALICWIVVGLSILKPIKIASQAPPIESAKIITVHKVNGCKIRKQKKITPISMGMMNFRREPRKVISIVISLSISGILLLIVSSMLLIQDPEKMARTFFPNGDFKVYIDSEREHVEILQQGNPLNEELRKEILEIPGVKSIVVGRKSASFKAELEDSIGNGTCDMITEENRTLIKDALSDGVMPSNNYEILLIDNYVDFGGKQKIGSKVNLSLGNKSVPVQISGYFSATKLPNSAGHGKRGMDAPMMYIPEELFEELLPGVGNYDYSWDIVSDPAKAASIENELKSIVDSHEEIALDTVFNKINFNKATNATMYGALQAIAWMIFLFGVLNLINTTLSNQIARQHENSIMYSVGMTHKQLCKMVICEGGCYVVSSVIFTLLIGLPVAVLVCQQVGKISYGRSVGYKFPFAHMTIYIIVICLLEIILSIWVIKKQKRISVIEMIREY